ncbi:MAG: FAD-binding protein, partial [Anaerolineales bacterium]|nr:FAD-binding protein [Anaerolineales bacterium]
IGGKRYLYLDMRPEVVNKYAAQDGRKRPDGSPYVVTGEELLSKLPDIVDFARTYLGVDPVAEPMPVQPTAHYAMGGIPTNMYGEVVIDEMNTVMPGMYAAGEAACVSVHGANRLGTNSLVDIIVFGKYSGVKAAEFANGASFQPLPADPTEFTRQQLEDIRNSKGSENVYDIGNEMKAVMFDHVGVFRTEDGMKQALAKVQELRQRIAHIKPPDQGKIFNTDVLSAWEMKNLLELAEVTTLSALERKESRGAHAREDYPKRDDANWLKHTLAWWDDGKIRLSYKPVVITKYQPKERVY